MNEAIEKLNPGNIARQEFGANELTTSGELSANMLAVMRAKEVEARFIMAMKRPRDWDVVRIKLLGECEREGFADTAWYAIKNRGEGFTIKFAEAALRNIGNLDARSEIIFEDDNKRLILVTVMDIENNVSLPTTISVSKTVERRSLKKGEIAISERINSYGEVTYLRACTDDELLQKTNAAISKALRNGVLRLLPGDIQSECARRIVQIKQGAAAKDPAGYKKRVIDSFASLNIGPSDLKKVLGHEIGTASPEELVMLRDIYSAIKGGFSTWHELTNTEDEQSDKPALAQITEKLKAKQAEKSTDDNQPEPVAVPADAFDVFAELSASAKQMWGKNYEKLLSELAQKHGYDMDKLTEDQAGDLLDAIEELRNA